MSTEQAYVHGYGETEHDRLIHQAVTLEPFLHRNVAFDPGSSVLEIGCGVGAQLRLLASRHPRTRFWGVDISLACIAAARRHLAKQIDSGQVSVSHGDGRSLPFPDAMFDSVVIFFVLEHVPEPLAVIHEAHRLLKPGGVFFCTEVVNSNVIASPGSELLMDYWSSFNAYQRELGGDPDIGIKLGGLLHRAGFRQVELGDASVMLDERTRDPDVRKAIVDNWISVFLSADERLVACGLVRADDGQALRREFARYLRDVQSVFVYAAVQARGLKIPRGDKEESCCT